LELLLEESDADDWVFRRDPRIRRPLSDIVARDSGGVPFLTPEIQLLFKAKARRERDEGDFENVAPELSPGQRAWLADALRIVRPAHDWIAQLA
jgi:hypothetical protein